MPWAALGEPSLGLAILKACLSRAGVQTRVRHLNLSLLRYLKASTYVGLANAYALNDFVFTYDLDPDVSGLQYRLAWRRLAELEQIGLLRLSQGSTDEALEALLDARRTIFPKWLDECAAFVARERPTLVGLTCLFDQTLASVALARRIRQRLPGATIVLGGYALEGPVGGEVLRCFPWVDATCSGEGEPAVVELARASVGQRPLQGIPNLLTRTEAESGDAWAALPSADGLARRAPLANRSSFVSLDEVPIPDFDDYFADLQELKDEDGIEIEVDTLPVESSRGCWWGQRSHCVFCGIDDESLQYRARSPASTLEMLDSLNQRYGVWSFRFSDYILPHSYFRSLLPVLASRESSYHLECEIKSNLDDNAFQVLRRAGFGEVQPGIESFSTPVLTRMAKGVTGIHNIQTLTLGRIHGIRIHWNFLFGFPDDEAVDYEGLTAVIPLLYHLDPPHGCQPVEVTRFAPLQSAPERFGIGRARHAALYDLVFSPTYLAKSGFDLDSYCYYFERTFSPTRQLKRAYAQLKLQIDHWKRLHAVRNVVLEYQDDGDILHVVDSRHSEEAVRTELRGPPAEVVRVTTGRATTGAAIGVHLGASETEAYAILERLVEQRLLVREGKRFLGLSIPAASADRSSAFRRKWVTA